jgi:hypothetical protein
MTLKDRGLVASDFVNVILNEDQRQRNKWGLQKHSADRWMTILTEEVGEVAEAILEDNEVEIQEEAKQVATVAIKMFVMIQQRREKPEPAPAPASTQCNCFDYEATLIPCPYHHAAYRKGE